MSNRQHLERAIECFGNPPRRSEYFDLYSQDAELHGYQGLRPGLENIKKFYEDFWSVFPDAKVTVQELIEEIDVIVIRYVITGMQRQTFMGVAPAEQAIELPGISILHFRNGRCSVRWTCSDSLVLLNQLRGIEASSA